MNQERTITFSPSKEIVQQFTLDCFLHHKIKLRRNWGSGDETDQLPFKDVTLLQFVNKSNTFQILIRPKEGTINILRLTNRTRTLFLYFVKKLELMMRNEYHPNF
jgi:hypothetical protein